MITASKRKLRNIALSLMDFNTILNHIINSLWFSAMIWPNHFSLCQTNSRYRLQTSHVNDRSVLLTVVLKSFHSYFKPVSTIAFRYHTVYISPLIKSSKNKISLVQETESNVWIAKRAKCSSNSRTSSDPASQLGGVPVHCVVSRICVPVGWLSPPGTETWWQWRQVSHQPMESSIIRQGEQEGRGRVIWAQHMHFPVGRGGRQGRTEARYGVTLLESVIWHLLCVWVCQRAGEGF